MAGLKADNEEAEDLRTTCVREGGVQVEMGWVGRMGRRVETGGGAGYKKEWRADVLAPGTEQDINGAFCLIN